MWRLTRPVTFRPGEGLPPGKALPAERALLARWRREAPEDLRRLEKAGTALQAARTALTLQETLELNLRADNPGMTAMEAEQHTRHVLNLKPVDPS